MTIVLDPSVYMTVPGIAMRPVDDAALRIPFVLAVELDRISRLERAEPAREIDIVRDQHCVPGSQANDEALVATALVVVSEDFGDAATALNLHVAAMILEGRCQCVAGTADGCARTSVCPAAAGIRPSRKEPALLREIYGRKRNPDYYQPLDHI
jgi:hypothetical protein